MGISQNEFEEELRQALAIALLNRADKSGETMRTLLFAADGAHSASC
jgi:hypothetical protein